MSEKIKKNNKIRNSKGITLIALILTIIILVILASISFNALTRRKWRFNKCDECKNKA